MWDYNKVRSKQGQQGCTPRLDVHKAASGKPQKQQGRCSVTWHLSSTYTSPFNFHWYISLHQETDTENHNSSCHDREVSHRNTRWERASRPWMGVSTYLHLDRWKVRAGMFLSFLLFSFSWRWYTQNGEYPILNPQLQIGPSSASVYTDADLVHQQRLLFPALAYRSDNTPYPPWIPDNLLSWW